MDTGIPNRCNSFGHREELKPSSVDCLLQREKRNHHKVAL